MTYFKDAEAGEVLRPGEQWQDTRGRTWVVEEVTQPPDPVWPYQVRARRRADGVSKRVFGNPPPRGWTLVQEVTE